MLPPDKQRLEHILDYCCEIEKTIARYGSDFAIFDRDGTTSALSPSAFCKSAS